MTGKSKIAALVLGVAVTMGHQAAGEETHPVQHPVLRHDIDPKNTARYERTVRRIMAMDEAQMLRLIPVKSCIMFCGCPNCSAGQQENGQFEWTIERPSELACKFCDHVYPSDAYPMNWTATGLNGRFVRGHFPLLRHRRTGGRRRRANSLARGAGHGDLSGQGSTGSSG